MKPDTEYKAAQWRNRLQRDATCDGCFLEEPTHQCKVCRKLLPQSAYEYEQWHNRMQRGATCH
eukprot:11874187-Karenia_brevis.AAC.1